MHVHGMYDISPDRCEIGKRGQPAGPCQRAAMRKGLCSQHGLAPWRHMPLLLSLGACPGRSTRRMVQAALQKRGAEARSALVWAAVMGDAEAAVALLGRGERVANQQAN